MTIKEYDSVTLLKLQGRLSLEVLEVLAPEVFHELCLMEGSARTVLLAWLNGKTTSPAGYGQADVEVIKEDASCTVLKVKHGIEFCSEKCGGNRSVHFMDTGQVLEFFNNREEMRKRVIKHVEDSRKKRAEVCIINAKQQFGFEWVSQILKGEDPRDAANDVSHNKNGS